LAIGYVRAAAALGATVLGGTAVTGIASREGAVERVETAGGPIEAPVVVDAAGAWARLVGAAAGRAPAATPTRHPPPPPPPLPGACGGAGRGGRIRPAAGPPPRAPGERPAGGGGAAGGGQRGHPPPVRHGRPAGRLPDRRPAARPGRPRRPGRAGRGPVSDLRP